MVKIRAMEIVIVIVVVLIVGLGLRDCKLAVGVSSFLLLFVPAGTTIIFSGPSSWRFSMHTPLPTARMVRELPGDPHAGMSCRSLNNYLYYGSR